MFQASAWQWSRYHWKNELLASYRSNATTAPLTFPKEGISTSNNPTDDRELRAKLRFHKVRLHGRFDYAREVIVTNRKNAEGPGHLLLTPFILSENKLAVWVSRGFIPFPDRTRDTWAKYDERSDEFDLDGVVQEGKTPIFLGPENPEVEPGKALPDIWLYEETEKLARILPYPSVTSLFVQRLGPPDFGALATDRGDGRGPNFGRYPEEAVTIQVPPSTHFGYTIEWAILGTLTLLFGFLRQAFPRTVPSSRTVVGAPAYSGGLASISPEISPDSTDRGTVAGAADGAHSTPLNGHAAPNVFPNGRRVA